MTYPPVAPAQPATPPYTDNSNLAGGLLVPTTRGWRFTTGAPTAQRVYMARFVSARARKIDAILFGIESDSGTATDTVDAAILDSAATWAVGLATPVNNVRGSSGIKTIVLDNPIVAQPGVAYYAAILFGTFATTAPTVTMADLGSGRGLQFPNFTPRDSDFQNVAANAIPRTALTGGGGISNGIPLFLRDKTN